MDANRQKRVAKEWLFFSGSLIFGVFLSSIILASSGEAAIEVFIYLIGAEGFYGFLASWSISLMPYVFVQFIRATIWAIKILR